MKKNFIYILVICLILMTFTSCGDDEVDHGENRAFVYSIAANPQNLDPQVTTDNSSLIIIKNVFEGLCRTDEYGAAAPGVALSWSHNSDYTQFVFVLRQDAKWSDERPVTAHDFVFAWQRGVDPATNSPTGSTLFCLKNAAQISSGAMPPSKLGVTATDDYTLVVNLAYPYPEFPVITGTAPFMPCNKDYFSSTKGHYGMDDDQLICNGPFTLTEKSWVKDEQVKVFKNEFYVGQNVVTPRSVNFVIRKNKVDYLSNVIAGTADAAAFEYSDLERVKENKLNYISFTDTTWGLAFNTKHALMSSKDIRLAFAYSIDNTAYVNHIPAGMMEAYDIIPPATHLNGQLYRELVGNGYKLSQDIDAAKLYLKNGLGNLGHKTLPKVTILCPEGEDILLMMQYLLQSWQENLKVYINIEQLSLSDIKTRIRQGDYQIALYPVTPTKDGPLTCLNIFRSSNSSNPSKYSGYAYEALLDTAATAQSQEEAIASLVAAERMLNEEAVFYPLYYGTSYFALRNGVSRIIFSPFDASADFSQALRLIK